MPNDYYNYNNDLLPGTKTRSAEIDEQFAAVEAGFDLLSGQAELAVGANIAGTDGGTADNYAVTTIGGQTTLVDLQLVTFVPTATNTGASTLTYNGGSNFPIVRNNGLPTEGGDLVAGIPVMLIWDGTNNRWVIIGSTAQQISEQIRPGVKTEAGATYTLALADEAFVINFTSACTVTVPPNSSIPFAVGSIVHLHQAGAGQVTVAQGAGVSIRFSIGLKARTQYSTLSLIKVGTDEWHLIGDATSL